MFLLCIFPLRRNLSPKILFPLSLCKLPVSHQSLDLVTWLPHQMVPEKRKGITKGMTGLDQSWSIRGLWTVFPKYPSASTKQGLLMGREGRMTDIISHTQKEVGRPFWKEKRKFNRWFNCEKVTWCLRLKWIEQKISVWAMIRGQTVDFHDGRGLGREEIISRKDSLFLYLGLCML